MRAKKPLEELSTDRLFMRRVVLSDAKAIFEGYACDPEVARYMSWPCTGRYIDTERFVKSAIIWWNEPDLSEGFIYSMTLRDDGSFVGCCSAGPHNPGGEYHWGIGYNLARPYWGRGYATEAIRELSLHAMDLPGIYRLSAIVDLENAASARVLEKCGFTREGILRRYSILPNVSKAPRDVFVYAMTR